MASIPDNYEINVAKKEKPDDNYGRHFCKIQLSESFDESAEEKLNFFRNLLGDEYNVTMTHWQCRGYSRKNWN